MNVEDELAAFFRAKGIRCSVRVEKRFSPSFPHYDKIQVDVVLDDKIAVEFKPKFNTDSIQTGIGQAILYRCFYEESWLAVPNIAMEILKPLMEKIGLEAFKVLDWENMELYEIKDGQVVSNKL